VLCYTELVKSWKSFRYKNTTFFFLSVVFAVLLFRYQPFHAFLLGLGGAGYIGAFFAGFLFVLSFTVATASVILLVLSERLSPLEVGIFAGLGAMVGDLIIFRFIKDGVAEEVTPLYNSLGGKRITKLLQKKYLKWMLPVIGAIIIASPFPDEIGVALMGVSKIKQYQFLLLTFILNATGIFLLLSITTSLTH
jgi:hypothetical protein